MSGSRNVGWGSVRMPEQHGIVLDAAERWCTVLTPDGEFLRVRRQRQMGIGRSIVFNESMVVGQGFGAFRRLRRLVGACGGPGFARAASYAAVLLLVLGLTFGDGAKRIAGTPATTPSISEVRRAPGAIVAARGPVAVPVSYVTMDINPSIEFGLDADGVVVVCRGLNEDGVSVVEESSVLGLSLERAVVSLSQEAYKQGFLKKGQQNQILLAGVSVSDLAEGDLASTLEVVRNEAMADLSKKEPGVDVRMSALAVPSAVRSEAEEAQLSIGKYIVLDTARTSGAKLSADQVRGASLRDVLESVGLGVSDIVREYNAAVGPEPYMVATQVTDPGASEAGATTAPTSAPAANARAMASPARAPARVSEREDSAPVETQKVYRLEAPGTPGVIVLPTLTYEDRDRDKDAARGVSVAQGLTDALSYSGGDNGVTRKVVVIFELVPSDSDGPPKVQTRAIDRRAPGAG